MNGFTSSRPILMRTALWTAAVVMLFVWYLASAPFAQFAVDHGPASLRVRLNTCGAVLYFPVALYIQAGLPGTDWYMDYFNWCLEMMNRAS